MPYLINPLENGKFELIDEHFIHLYDVDKDTLISMSDKEYQIHQTRANHLTTFENGEFVYRDEVVDEKIIKKQQQDSIWESIKQKRHTITRGGVYVKSVKKWFHTDDSSRTQYLALQILPEIPPDLMWKTMDNTFVKMDKALLTELAMTILQAEQANFANAERHRAKMLQADNPLEYDYSDGWSGVYEQAASQATEELKDMRNE
ncbi:hypothetical protein AAX06_07920 [Moraxella bovoculi]|uniref:DUF4376 domain-containing protein n=1 Tax=Moraxella bovoculi TaxID=386891 RepID=A0AAC8PW36_9GAMM|nr:DUF4376 domain-containing protein [Moraxella bovoculi]AKG08083.1 hypothetical protein AAX06_07920 [Moraxella bovoculi]AKG11196.1 hypothetical protein AAX07_03355 [Moraxella bovoculi]